MESPSGQTPAGVKSFSISDILSHKPAKGSNGSGSHKDCSASAASGGRHAERDRDREVVAQQRIVRPWDRDAQNKSNGRRNSNDASPLDALFQMTSKTFDGLNGHHENSGKHLVLKQLHVGMLAFLLIAITLYKHCFNLSN